MVKEVDRIGRVFQALEGIFCCPPSTTGNDIKPNITQKISISFYLQASEDKAGKEATAIFSIKHYL